MEFVYGNAEDNIGHIIKNWFSEKSKTSVGFSYSCMGWVKDNKIITGIIFDNYTGSNIDMHIEGDKLTRQIIKNVFKYVFIQLNCNRLTAKPPKSNKKILHLLSDLNFTYEYTLKKYYGPNAKDAAIQFVLYKEDCNKVWLI